MTKGKLVRRVCFFCGETFYASNPTAKFDRPACRLKAFRWRNRVKLHEGRALTALQAMQEYLNYTDSGDAAKGAIARVQNAYTLALKDGNIRRVK